MKLRLLVPIGIALLVLPFFALASALNPLSGAGEQPKPAVACPNLYRNLSFGSRGQNVVELQNFLIQEGDLAAENNTGYFGRMTETAVKSWQTRNGVVSSGMPSTTGYGAVGPKTRAAIARACAAGGSTQSSQPTTSSIAPLPSSFQPQCPLISLPIGEPCSGTWKEVKDANGCTASWQCAVQ